MTEQKHDQLESEVHHVAPARRSFEIAMRDGAPVRIRQHGKPGAPRLVLSHGNGLAIDGYFPFWGPLRERYEVIVFDMRNHGRNPLHTIEDHKWENFPNDLEAIFQAINRELGAKPAAGVFHSMSAVVAAMHSLSHGRRLDALVLFDPPIMPREGHDLLAHFQRTDKGGLADRARRRPPSYKDPLDLARQFERRFKHWRPEAYELMARSTLRHDRTSGEWVLACPREYEAQVFASSSNSDLWTRIAHSPVPIKLICGDPHLEGADAPTLIGQALAEDTGIAYEAIPETSHFLQIERPEQCVRAMEDFLRPLGLSA
jgi:pimeloyl-ACP methyl ester carboxylesterase